MAMGPMMPGVGGTAFGGGFGGGGASAPAGVTGPMGGKNAVAQNLMSPHSGLKSTITKGEPMSRMMSQYGKGHSFNAPTNTAQGSAKIRGSSGQVGHQLRFGGLGPGKMATPGGAGDYSMSSPDVE